MRFTLLTFIKPCFFLFLLYGGYRFLTNIVLPIYVDTTYSLSLNNICGFFLSLVIVANTFFAVWFICIISNSWENLLIGPFFVPAVFYPVLFLCVVSRGIRKNLPYAVEELYLNFVLLFIMVYAVLYP